MEIKHTTTSGVNIYTYKNPTLHGFYISLFVRAGSMYEDEGERGITHFLEHTLVRNVNKQRGGALYPTLDREALEFNASTYSEMVQFYVSGATEKFKIGAQILADVLSPISLSKSEVDTERRRIKAEIRESDDKSSLANFTSDVVFEGTSLAGSILGTNSGVDKISTKRLEEYRGRIFTAKNIFFYVTGNYTDEDISALSALVDSHSISGGSDLAVRDNVAPVPHNFGKRDADVRIKNADYTMIRFTFDVDMSRVSSQVLDLIYDMLLSGYNSPFFVEMSEERGMFYDITGATERYRNIGTIHFTYEVKEKNIYDAVRMTARILRDFKAKTYDESECMKGGYVDNAYMLYDDARECGFTLAYDNHIMGLGYKTLDERRATYSALGGEDVRTAAGIIFRPENLTITVKGNKRTLNKERIRECALEMEDNHGL